MKTTIAPVDRGRTASPSTQPPRKAWRGVLAGFAVLQLAPLLALAAGDGVSGDAGALDVPTSFSTTGKSTPTNQSTSRLDLSVEALSVSEAPADVSALQQAVSAELEVLETLSDAALTGRANRGERAAMVALGERFAVEAATLAFSPAAANAALSDAVRYYSLAASHGFPGAPSLTEAGIRFYPIRMYRGPHKP